jgi:hypothetical protein
VSKRLNSNHFLILIVGLYLIYAIAFIWKTSFVIDGQRYFCLNDDSMVSMRYARHFAQGLGLVWNPSGERVEGSTCPLWMFYMSMVHFLRVPLPYTSLFMQIMGAILLATNLVFVKRLADSVCPDRVAVGLLATVLTAFYYPLNVWGLFGNEASLLALLMTCAVLSSLNSSMVKFSRLPYLLLGVAMLVRSDMVIPFITFFCFQLLFDKPNRRVHFFSALCTSLVFILAPAIARLCYFGDVLPNTYYLKLTGYPIGLRLLSGFVGTLRFIFRMNFVLFLLPLTLLTNRPINRTVMLMLVLIVSELCYNIYVGGDVWDPPVTSRYISVVMPLFFIVFAFAACQLRFKASSPALACALTAVLFLCVLVNFNLEPNLEAGRWLLWKPPFQAADNKYYVEQARLIDRITTKRARIAVCWAGIVPYFTDRECIDQLGKTDKRIAHEPAHDLRPPSSSGLLTFLPGHNKWDYSYSIGGFKPDVVTAIWPVWGDPIAQKLLDRDYVHAGNLYLRKGSREVTCDDQL